MASTIQAASTKKAVTSRNSALSLPKDTPGMHDATDAHATAAVDVGVGEEPVGHGVGEGEGGQGQVEIAEADGGKSDESPHSAQIAVAASSPSSEPPPAIFPMTNAPIPMKENWQRETWPE